MVACHCDEENIKICRESSCDYLITPTDEVWPNGRVYIFKPNTEELLVWTTRGIDISFYMKNITRPFLINGTVLDPKPRLKVNVFLILLNKTSKVEITPNNNNVLLRYGGDWNFPTSVLETPVSTDTMHIRRAYINSNFLMEFYEKTTYFGNHHYLNYTSTDLPNKGSTDFIIDSIDTFEVIVSNPLVSKGRFFSSTVDLSIRKATFNQVKVTFDNTTFIHYIYFSNSSAHFYKDVLIRNLEIELMGTQNETYNFSQNATIDNVNVSYGFNSIDAYILPPFQTFIGLKTEISLPKIKIAFKNGTGFAQLSNGVMYFRRLCNVIYKTDQSFPYLVKMDNTEYLHVSSACSMQNSIIVLDMILYNNIEFNLLHFYKKNMKVEFKTLSTLDFNFTSLPNNITSVGNVNIIDHNASHNYIFCKCNSMIEGNVRSVMILPGSSLYTNDNFKCEIIKLGFNPTGAGLLLNYNSSEIPLLVEFNLFYALGCSNKYKILSFKNEKLQNSSPTFVFQGVEYKSKISDNYIIMELKTSQNNTEICIHVDCPNGLKIPFQENLKNITYVRIGISEITIILDSMDSKFTVDTTALNRIATIHFSKSNISHSVTIRGKAIIADAIESIVVSCGSIAHVTQDNPNDTIEYGFPDSTLLSFGKFPDVGIIRMVSVHNERCIEIEENQYSVVVNGMYPMNKISGLLRRTSGPDMRLRYTNISTALTMNFERDESIDYSLALLVVVICAVICVGIVLFFVASKFIVKIF